MTATAYLVASVLAGLFLGWIPGLIASNRRHRNTAAITVCGFIGAFVWPFWLAALVWSLTSDVDKRPATKARKSGRRKKSTRRARILADAEGIGNALEKLSDGP